MTMLIATVLDGTSAEVRRRAKNALAGGADMVELRLDSIRSGVDGMESIFGDLPPGQWLATCRSAIEGGFSKEPLTSRIDRILSAIRGGAGLIDVEYSDWVQSEATRHDILQALAAPAKPDQFTGLVISHHSMERCPENLVGLVQNMIGVREASAVKIVWPAEDILSNFQALDLLRGLSSHVIAICMGETGLLSRVLAPKLGAFAGFAAADANTPGASGQLPVSEMCDRFRWASIDEATEFYGVIGNPVAHSIGPDVFNRVFEQARLNSLYLPLEVNSDFDSFRSFLEGIAARPWLDARGFSVTLPHKEHAFRFLGDRIDPPADLIGAVNTIRVEDGEFRGSNTDIDAAILTLLGGLGCDEDALDGLGVCILGAGGAARAVTAGLVDFGCRVTLFNRSAERAALLAEEFDCEFGSWEDRISAEGQVLINCTSVGMWPDVDETPMPIDALRPEMFIFDTVYRPVETRLLREARQIGCQVVHGFGMFARQAALQFEYWTQQPADLELFMAVAAGALQEPDQ